MYDVSAVVFTLIFRWSVVIELTAWNYLKTNFFILGLNRTRM